MTKAQQTVNDLVSQYGYQPLPSTYSDTYRKIYEKELPSWAKTGDLKVLIIDMEGVHVTRGFTRIVISDYGAFIEFNRDQSAGLFRYVDQNEFLLMEQILAGYYTLLSTRKGSKPRIYYWQYPVPFGDFKPGMYYVSVDDVKKA